MGARSFGMPQAPAQQHTQLAQRDVASDPRVKRWARAKYIVYLVLVVVLFIFYYRFDQLLAQLG